MSLDNGISNLTLYDAKKYFRKAQNMVFNYTEMEAKVREATNNEPWGASSTLMEQISQGTYNYREREEILGMIFRRFTEKTASEWRQIYKALQLLDYLIRHGAERFIDDTRANLSLIKMLESFHYIDSQGRDQGINVRNRAHELVLLLDDDGKIRAERRKARETAKKYKGVAGGAPSSYLPASAVNRTAGFGRSTNNGISVSADYDSEEEDYQNGSSARSGDNSNTRTAFKDLSPAVSGLESSIPRNDEGDNDDDDDDFADFQSAAPVTQAAPKATASTLADLYSGIPTQPAATGAGLSSPAPQISTTASAPQVNVAQKKPDPFAGLFSSAKVHSNDISKSKVVPTTQEASIPAPKTNTTASSNAEKEVEDDDDDGFGEMTQAAPSTSTTNAQEVDLLSF
ncbi:LAQU0S01e00254g1_1 [Lachancea quebecensis]|uniref:LAQU0S01e00254g1_1 n=1 Tax=Lachancea quebecensis TaxID=1654605 RepID=A0A0P1KKV0_9SACH|nr:LAQU0S01e00254g1_1 [Lachancea quebecensis]